MTASTFYWIGYGIAFALVAVYIYGLVWKYRTEARRTARYTRRVQERYSLTADEYMARVFWQSRQMRKAHYQAALAITVRRAAETHPLRLASIFPLAHVTDTPTLKEVV